MQSARSSNIRGVEYDAAQRVLVVQFTSGSTYRYAGVPADVYHRFRIADSAGSFFAKEIRHRYTGERVG